MTQILIAVAIVAITGLVAGLGLAIASIVMAVPKDEKAEAIREGLPLFQSFSRSRQTNAFRR